VLADTSFLHGETLVATLLIVDDDPSVLNIVALILENAGYNLLTAANGQAALHVLRKSQVPVDLVVSDIDMPIMNGYVFAKEMTFAYPDIPILFMSGSHSSWPPDRGEPYSFLAKPFSPAALLGVVQGLLPPPSPERHHRPVSAL
jgi:CheY-like chemotaxis protein